MRLEALQTVRFLLLVSLSSGCVPTSLLSGAFAFWAPNLFEFYVDQLGALFLHMPHLIKNFAKGVFAAATFNFGRYVVTRIHVDHLNLAFGWCAIAALGNYDPTKGGHIVLWDLRIVVEFPPGSTILLASGCMQHSNVAIQAHETRKSFTQYSAGGIFRWVAWGFKGWKQLDYLSQQKSIVERSERWESRLKQIFYYLRLETAL